ncbi:hypothetical protein TNCV_4450251 [Trichonephila clavipes]|nr:hypothetical protein TNCV_4450251 [Trichonephila clavipes]
MSPWAGTLVTQHLGEAIKLSMNRRACLADLFLAAKVHDYRHMVEEVIQASSYLADAANLYVDSEESADCQGHPNTANSIEKDSNFRICNHCWRGEVRKTPNPVKIGNLNFHALFKLQSLPLMTESCKMEKSATCATLQNV